MLKYVDYLPCGEKIGWELFRTILNELNKLEDTIEYTFCNPNIVQVNSSSFFIVARELENKKQLTRQHEDKGSTNGQN